MQGGYVAKRCPVRVQNDALTPAEPLAPSSVPERRFERGRLFEADVVAELLHLHPDAVAIDADDAATAEAATSDAMSHLTPLILGGRLVGDPVGRRVGKPDLLVTASGGGYRPVDIKHHASIEPAGRLRVAVLEALVREGAIVPRRPPPVLGQSFTGCHLTPIPSNEGHAGGPAARPGPHVSSGMEASNASGWEVSGGGA
jgi:hypothetical protein